MNDEEEMEVSTEDELKKLAAITQAADDAWSRALHIHGVCDLVSVCIMLVWGAGAERGRWDVWTVFPTLLFAIWLHNWSEKRLIETKQAWFAASREELTALAFRAGFMRGRAATARGLEIGESWE